MYLRRPGNFLVYSLIKKSDGTMQISNLQNKMDNLYQVYNRIPLGFLTIRLTSKFLYPCHQHTINHGHCMGLKYYPTTFCWLYPFSSSPLKRLLLGGFHLFESTSFLRSPIIFGSELEAYLESSRKRMHKFHTATQVNNNCAIIAETAVEK